MAVRSVDTRKKYYNVDTDSYQAYPQAQWFIDNIEGLTRIQRYVYAEMCLGMDFAKRYAKNKKITRKEIDAYIKAG